MKIITILFCSLILPVVVWADVGASANVLECGNFWGGSTFKIRRASYGNYHSALYGRRGFTPLKMHCEKEDGEWHCISAERNKGPNQPYLNLYRYIQGPYTAYVYIRKGQSKPVLLETIKCGSEDWGSQE